MTARRRARRPRMTLEEAIRSVQDDLNWRIACLFNEVRPEADAQARATRFYNAGFGARAAYKLARLLRRKANKTAGVSARIQISVRFNPKTLSDILQSETPADLIRRQRGGI